MKKEEEKREEEVRVGDDFAGAKGVATSQAYEFLVFYTKIQQIIHIPSPLQSTVEFRSRFN